MKETAVIIGASAGLGRALAYEIALTGCDCIIAARNTRDLEAIASDLRLRYSVGVEVIGLDISTLDNESKRNFIDKCFQYNGSIRQVYITAAVISGEDQGNTSEAVLEKITKTNFTGVSLIVAGFAERLKEVKANITLISSIATIRPRGNNLAYAASKIGMEYYARGLQHYYADHNCHIQIYRVGYMDTAMTSGKKLLFKKTDPLRVARFIIGRKSTASRLKYYPRYWGMVAIVLRALPWFIYKKLKF